VIQVFHIARRTRTIILRCKRKRRKIPYIERIALTATRLPGDRIDLPLLPDAAGPHALLLDRGSLFLIYSAEHLGRADLTRGDLRQRMRSLAFAPFDALNGAF
jgi:hypothetical protein